MAEYTRIYKLIKDEKENPANVGSNILFDWKKVVTQDGVIIDKFNPLFSQAHVT